MAFNAMAENLMKKDGRCAAGENGRADNRLGGRGVDKRVDLIGDILHFCGDNVV